MSILLAILAAGTATLPPRPVLPQVPVISASRCDEPADRQKIISGKGIERAKPSVAREYNSAWSTYLEARMNYIGMTEQERAEMANSVLKSDEFQAIQSENQGLVGQMFRQVEAIGAAKDDLAKCRAIAGLTATLPPIIANAERQYMLMDKRLDAEAAKRGK